MFEKKILNFLALSNFRAKNAPRFNCQCQRNEENL